MAFDKRQFEDLVRRVLGDHPELLSESAINLLLGTAAQESQFGTFIRQLNGGPALGIFQMEPTTFEWLKKLYTVRYKELADRKFEELEWDLRLSIIYARLRYRVVPKSLPENNVKALAGYWNKYYNRNPNFGTDEEFIANYRRFVLGMVA